MATTNSQQPEGYDEAVRILEANRDPRYWQLDAFERYVATTQYAGRPDWFSQDKPLFERAPCIAYPIVQAAISSNGDLLLGEGRFPTVTTIPDDAEEAKKLDTAAVHKTDRAIQKLLEQARLRKVSYEVFDAGQGCGTAVTICGARAGRLFVDTTRAKWCSPTFDERDEVTRLEIKYAYLDRHKENGRWRAKAKLYRRVIDEQKDTTYLPADAQPDGAEPNWVADPKRTYQHGLGFCPVVWYAHMRGAETVNRIDGHPIHEHCLDEIVAHDFAVSQRHRAALFAGDPQWIEIGCDEGGQPPATGKDPWEPMLTTLHGGVPSEENPVRGRWVGPNPRPARKKGPGEIWTYPDKDTKVQMVTLPGDALKAIDEHARDLRIKIAESLAVVFLDPESIKFAASLSGKALSTLKARQLDRCDQYRDDFGHGWLIPQVRMLLRVIGAVSGEFKLDGLGDARAALTGLGEDYELHLRWGDYFHPDPAEDKVQVELVAAARKGNLVSARTGLKKLAPVFDIENVDDELKALEKEAEENEAKAQEGMKAQAQAFHAAARIDGGSQKPTGGQGPGTQPNRPAGSRGGPPASATPARPGRAPTQSTSRR